MVFIHLPSNVLLCLVPLMPNQALAIMILLISFGSSQMGAHCLFRGRRDVSPALTGVFLASPALLGAPFLVAGTLKIAYDLLLYRNFRKADMK
jgi:hypothetical protein